MPGQAHQGLVKKGLVRQVLLLGVRGTTLKRPRADREC